MLALQHKRYFTLTFTLELFHCSVQRSHLAEDYYFAYNQNANKPTSVLVSSWEFNVLTSAIVFTKHNYLIKYISSEASTLKLWNSKVIRSLLYVPLYLVACVPGI